MQDAAPLLMETDRLTLRALDEGDAARLQAVFMACADHFQALTGRPAPDDGAAAAELAAAARTPGRQAVVLTHPDTGDDVGAIGFWEGNPAPDQALLGLLMVAPAHRGRGLAREALAGLEVWLAGRGVHGLRTAFERRRLAVHPVVRALGFTEMSIAEHTALGLGGAGVSLWEKRIGG